MKKYVIMVALCGLLSSATASATYNRSSGSIESSIVNATSSAARPVSNSKRSVPDLVTEAFEDV